MKTWSLEELQERRKRAQAAHARALHFARKQPSSGEARFAAAEMLRIHRENSDWLAVQVEECGWPLLSDIGEECAESLFILAQFADSNLELQRKIVQLMEALMPTGEVVKPHLAYLIDHVLVSDGNRQRFGTQCVFDADAGWIARPCENPGSIDHRRVQMGLPPLAEYLLELGRGVEV